MSVNFVSFNKGPRSKRGRNNYCRSYIHAIGPNICSFIFDTKHKLLSTIFVGIAHKTWPEGQNKRGEGSGAHKNVRLILDFSKLINVELQCNAGTTISTKANYRTRILTLSTSRIQLIFDQYVTEFISDQ